MKDVVDVCSKRLVFGMFGRNNIFRSALKQQNMAPLDIGKQEGRVGQQNDLKLHIRKIVVQPVRQKVEILPFQVGVHMYFWFVQNQNGRTIYRNRGDKGQIDVLVQGSKIFDKMGFAITDVQPDPMKKPRKYSRKFAPLQLVQRVEKPIICCGRGNDQRQFLKRFVLRILLCGRGACFDRRQIGQQGQKVGEGLTVHRKLTGEWLDFAKRKKKCADNFFVGFFVGKNKPCNGVRSPC